MAPRFLRYLCLLTGFAFISASVASNNELKDHPSPYLALHGADPVAWQDWGESVVARARREQKLLYLSVGYFSCHWCHVMQKESYQNDAIAQLLNDNFIPVKIDRELEPALDARLIEFAQSTQGRAGWPLNVFLTPQGHPLYAALYMPPEAFLELLNKLVDLWRADPQNLARMAALASASDTATAPIDVDEYYVETAVQSAVSQALEIADIMEGGFGRGNKFPMAPQLTFLLEQYTRQPDPDLGELLRLTLDNMAGNGIYDHIGGGFFRYATDPGWDTPHFEKMLYDNTQLAIVYFRAARIFEEERYTAIGANTLEFLSREMMAVDGAMVASFSAVDGQSVEGGYYLWSSDELSVILTEEERAIAELAWALDVPNQFEAGNLPRRGLTTGEISNRLSMSEPEVDRGLESARIKLQSARGARVLPVDTKLLAGWNGLALATYAEVARIATDDAHVQSARRIRDYIVTRLWDGKTLQRAVKDGHPLGQVSLQDYAFVSLGLLEWVRLVKSVADVELLRTIVSQAWDRFYDQGWQLSSTGIIPDQPARLAIPDGPMPSPSAVLIQVSLALAQISGDSRFADLARDALRLGSAQLSGNWFWHVSHIQAMQSANPWSNTGGGAQTD